MLKSCDVGIRWNESRMYDRQGIHGFGFCIWIIAALGQTSSCFLLFCAVLSFFLLFF